MSSIFFFLNLLDNTLMRLRKKIKGKKLTKTIIIEKPLELALGDLESQGDKSELYKKLAD